MPSVMWSHSRVLMQVLTHGISQHRTSTTPRKLLAPGAWQLFEQIDHRISVEQCQQDVIAKPSGSEGATLGACAQAHSQAQGQQSSLAGSYRNTLDSENKSDVMAKITGNEPVPDIL